MDKRKKEDKNPYTEFPNNIYERLLSYGFNATQLLVVLYVIRKTYGFHKPEGDKISIKKMATDIGKSRRFTTSAVDDLEKMGVLERYSDGNESKTGIKIMRITNPGNWDKDLSET